MTLTAAPALPAHPPPLIPADVDITGFPYMPLYVDRLLKSKSWLICKRKPELAFFMVNLWMRAWHERPGASLENDDDVLADAARCDPLRWDTYKRDVMRAWVLCSDGRWYHPVCAELVRNAWESRLALQWRRESDRLRKENKLRAEAKLDALPVPTLEQWKAARVPPETAHFPPESLGFPAESSLNREGEGNGREREVKNPGGTPPRPPVKRPLRVRSGKRPPKVVFSAVPSANAHEPRQKVLGLGVPREFKVHEGGKPEAPTTATWNAYRDAFITLKGVEPQKRNKAVNGALWVFVEQLGADAPHVAAWYVAHRHNAHVQAEHCIEMLVKHRASLHTQWKRRRMTTAAEAHAGEVPVAHANVFAEANARLEQRKQEKANGN